MVCLNKQGEALQHHKQYMGFVNELSKLDKSILVFAVNEKLDEKDYPIIFVKPNLKTIKVLKEHTDALHMYKHYLLERI